MAHIGMYYSEGGSALLGALDPRLGCSADLASALTVDDIKPA